ncbi:hypothetical protein Xcel_2431 [Xylanimonas cellulosilytica DSM 15894]|uniref:DNA-binding protein n=1 Tax=Xylanimonas cellulosilytica (strain DSM 15894 / JCM 12276 / CECT 5975 / KCTC 9989 / LMG 20990 / NBRC 107835 / XIL07) TaxID=446471 RepID=D1BWA1_XYLCX|nr:DNA-binding protein [Xylanimonas cellulosilytica]ACZ31446.1 hypothetical protein Xcel_2431 [Xylanimonas cellulosilytica DSM 15894]
MEGNTEHSAAERSRAAREHLATLRDEAWPAAPPSAVDLIHLTLRRSAERTPDDLTHALTLLAEARAEVDGLEAGLLFAARGAGLTWAQIADAMGFRSPQACQQHFTRLTARLP